MKEKLPDSILNEHYLIDDYIASNYNYNCNDINNNYSIIRKRAKVNI